MTHLKFELARDLPTLEIDNRTLYRIRALRSGAVGGFVECESNLSQTGDSWIGDDAMVYGGAQVSEFPPRTAPRRAAT